MADVLTKGTTKEVLFSHLEILGLQGITPQDHFLGVLHATATITTTTTHFAGSRLNKVGAEDYLAAAMMKVPDVHLDRLLDLADQRRTTTSGSST